MKMNTDSNVYTIVYSIVLVVIVAVLLAVVNQGLKARQEANKLLDTQKQMLVALNQDIDNCDDPAALYDSLVKDTVMCGESPVIVFEVEGQTKYMLRLHGQGLWGGIGGYMALNDDCNTVFGINFNHESETPGLGGEIVTEKFRSQFTVFQLIFRLDCPAQGSRKGNHLFFGERFIWLEKQAVLVIFYKRNNPFYACAVWLVLVIVIGVIGTISADPIAAFHIQIESDAFLFFTAPAKINTPQCSILSIGQFGCCLFISLGSNFCKYSHWVAISVLIPMISGLQLIAVAHPFFLIGRDMISAPCNH